MKKVLLIRSWIDIDGHKFFGLGRAQLLKQIEATGSIAEAARRMGMSYKKAWAMIADLNAKASKAYVVVKKGGGKGGETVLTPAGRKMLEGFEKLETDVQKIIEKHKGLLKAV
jgi:molybdate transport system regulatory protein